MQFLVKKEVCLNVLNLIQLLWLVITIYKYKYIEIVQAFSIINSCLSIVTMFGDIYEKNSGNNFPNF